MTIDPKKKSRLGRGLDGLLPPAPATFAPRETSSANSVARIEELHANRAQPRRNFDDARLDELAASIAEHGILEPILVRKRAAGGFEIIAGERRWRAAGRAGLREVPIFVRELSETVAFEAAIVENLQREDLNAIETASAFQRLVEDFGHTQEQIAKRVGKDRSTIANSLRLLRLPSEVQAHIASGELSEGHGRALLGCADDGQIKRLAAEALQKHLTVRDIERLVKGGSAEPKAKVEKSANVKDLERRISHALGATVQVNEVAGKKGTLVISYSGYDHLDMLLKRFGVSN